MRIPQEILDRLEVRKPLVAEIPSPEPDLHCYLIIFKVSKTPGRQNPPPFKVLYAEVREHMLKKYWDENIDIGGYDDYAEHHTEFYADSVSELEEIVSKWLNQPEQFLKPPRIDFPF